MSKFKKVLLSALSYVLVGAVAIGGTLAYLSDSDSDVNVMTMGKVKIAQHEYERVLNADGTYEMVNSTKYGVGYKLQEFTQAKPLYPATGAITGWGTKVPFDQIEGASGAQAVFAGLNNVQDKFVLVENTGKSDAYVRTLIALEYGSNVKDIIGISTGDFWTWNDIGIVEIDSNNYNLFEAIYKGSDTRHVGGVLPAGEYTYNSLGQIYLKNEATNEDVEALDGNNNGTYDILVLSQAVQTAGFDNAQSALDEAFGAPNDVDVNSGVMLCASWFGETIDEYEAGFVDKWDGTIDTSWYNENDSVFTLTTAEQFAGLGKLVDDGNTFSGKTVKIDKNFDLEHFEQNGEKTSFNPIGYGYDVVFKGTFDGQGNTISNLYQNGWALGLDYSTEGGGLFASVVDATIKNLTIDNAEIVMECIDMGTLVGYSYGNCTYENIVISNSTIANYNRYTGGVVGEVNGTQTFKNVDVIDTTVSALWGTYDASLGGIIGGKWGEANITFENCDVSAKLDAFNDVCSNYQYYNYRLCGMLIGMSEEVTNGFASASYLTCKNCTVTYNDWANYTYCESESYGKPSYADQGEWKFKRVQEGYATDGVDANHTHDTDETHEELLVFDQLLGGDKGVKGLKEFDGVTVVYNNK